MASTGSGRSTRIDWFATEFATLGLLDAVSPLLVTCGWDGYISSGPHRPWQAHDRSSSPTQRHRNGVHYTPEPVATALTQLALQHVGSDATVGDPACGTGVFLLAAAEVLAERGVSAEVIVSERLFGADIDPLAVQLARVELTLWAARRSGAIIPIPDDHLFAVDGLGTEAGISWVDRSESLTAVVGNPPFGSQLKGNTVRSHAVRRHLHDRLGLENIGYADTAMLFLVRAVDLVHRGGVVSLILPSSVAGASGSARLRRVVTARADLIGLWDGGSDVGFDASVSVFAPILRIRRKSSDEPPRLLVDRFVGRDVSRSGSVRIPADPTRWASLLVDPASLPAAALEVLAGDNPKGTDTLSSVANVTAGFRQHFYGLAPHVVDDPAASTTWPLLVTTGAVDPLHHRSDEPVRFAGRSWSRPVVDMASLERQDPGIAAWVRSLLVPKVIVGSQGRVLEVIVDRDGNMVPSTPAIAVVPTEQSGVSVWHVAALLCSPWESARLHHEAGGTGLGAGSCRVTAKFIASVVLPDPCRAWDRAAAAARRAQDASQIGDEVTWTQTVDDIAANLTRIGAPGLATDGPLMPQEDEELLDWWKKQRPPLRRARTLSS